MNDPRTLRQRALKCLARREHSRAELATKLRSLGTPEDIEATLTDLEHTGLLSDARFAESYLRTHASRKGTLGLRYALQTRGVAADLIQTQMAELPDELERARTVWGKKFPHTAMDSRERGKQARFLQNRGFSADVIHHLLNHAHPRCS